MSKRCPYCGWYNSDSAVRCLGCGYELKKYWDNSKGRPEYVDTTKD